MKGMVNQAELAERCGVSRPTLRRWMASGKIPKPHCILGHTKMWNERWLASWLSNQSARQKAAEDAAERAKVEAENAEFLRKNPHIAALHKKLGIN